MAVAVVCADEEGLCCLEEWSDDEREGSFFLPVAVFDFWSLDRGDLF